MIFGDDRLKNIGTSAINPECRPKITP